jgi:hypothetical protein
MLLRCKSLEPPMSQLGHKQTSRRHSREVRFAPQSGHARIVSPAVSSPAARPWAAIQGVQNNTTSKQHDGDAAAEPIENVT